MSMETYILGGIVSFSVLFIGSRFGENSRKFNEATKKKAIAQIVLGIGVIIVFFLSWFSLIIQLTLWVRYMLSPSYREKRKKSVETFVKNIK